MTPEQNLNLAVFCFSKFADLILTAEHKMSKKRRSSTFSAAASTPAPRGSSGHDDTVESAAGETPVAILERAQEDAERRGRVRIQKRQSLGHAMAHAAVAAAVGQQTPVQADGTPIQPGIDRPISNVPHF